MIKTKHVTIYFVIENMRKRLTALTLCEVKYTRRYKTSNKRSQDAYAYQLNQCQKLNYKISQTIQ